MGKARSTKRAGFWGEAVNFVKDTAAQAKEAVEDMMTPDPGTLGDKLKNPKKYRDKAIAEATEPKPKPKPKTTPQTKNKQLAADEKRSQKLSKDKVEEIRRRLQAGEKVTTKEYE